MWLYVFKCPKCKQQTVTPTKLRSEYLAQVSPYCLECDDQYMDFVEEVEAKDSESLLQRKKLEES